MMLGTRIIAPDGYRNLKKGVGYYFLISDPARSIVRLVEYLGEGQKLRAVLVTLKRVEFEAGLDDCLIQEDKLADMCPPWLEPIKGLSIAELENSRVSAKKTYHQMVDNRYLSIASLVLKVMDILSSPNPDSCINAHAKENGKNAGYLRLWFYTYITFGFSKWALIPQYFRNGRWDRQRYPRKMGRPSLLGGSFGYPSDLDMQTKILEGRQRFSTPDATSEEVYKNIVTKMFGCKSVCTDDGLPWKDRKFLFVHPEGKPFPTMDQVRYRIDQYYSAKDRSIAARGKQKTRDRSGHLGSFAQGLTNVCQVIEFDGFYPKYKYSGVLEGSALDSFCVVRAICGLSGMVLGIGFADNHEKMKAYEMCLFSIACDKVKYCELFGLSITSDQWPNFGLPPSVIFDRGPGASYKIEPQINWLSAFELTPVFSGQSKASIEASHPRQKPNSDQPTFFHSDLNFVEAAKREIYELITRNSKSTVSGRMEESMIIDGVRPNPISIWSWYDGRARNSAIGRPFDYLVRDFLDQQSATIREDAVYFYGRKYRSRKLTESGVFDRVATYGKISAKVYVLTMCVRHIWIEVNGLLYELDVVVSQRTADGETDISLSRLKELDRLRREAVRKHLMEKPAVSNFFDEQYKVDTGLDPKPGKRKKGRPSKSSAWQLDKTDLNGFLGKLK